MVAPHSVPPVVAPPWWPRSAPAVATQPQLRYPAPAAPSAPAVLPVTFARRNAAASTAIMSVSWAADIMKPGFERVRTRSKPGYMWSRLTRSAQIAVLAVPVLPEPG